MSAQKCMLCFSDGAVAEYDGSKQLTEIECSNSACGDYVITNAAALAIEDYPRDKQIELSRAAKEAALFGLILELEIGNRREVTAIAVTRRSRR
jgi:hypothetical protein